MGLKRKIANSAAGLAALVALSSIEGGCWETPCTAKIKTKHSKEQIEAIVSSYNTPEEAYDYVARSVQFKMCDMETYRCPDRWNSLQETLATGVGDCEDGAIAFIALLSDNPEYGTGIIKLVPKEWENKARQPSHVIALFSSGGKWGYASFSDFDRAKTSRFKDAVYESMEEAVKAYSEGAYLQFYTVSFTAEEIKFGSALQKLLFERTSKIASQIKD